MPATADSTVTPEATTETTPAASTTSETTPATPVASETSATPVASETSATPVASETSATPATPATPAPTTEETKAPATSETTPAPEAESSTETPAKPTTETTQETASANTETPKETPTVNIEISKETPSDPATNEETPSNTATNEEKKDTGTTEKKEEGHRGTIRFRDEFSAGDAAETLRNAMSGFGTDEDAVIECLGNHCLEQRLEIEEAYKQAYGKSLIDDIKSELRGDFEDTTVAMLTPHNLLCAKELREAMEGMGTDEVTIIEVLCTKTNEEIEAIKEAYNTEYDRSLEDDLVDETSGYFRRMLVSILNAGREEEEDVDPDRAAEDAQKFFEAGEARWGTEEAELNAILCLRSRPQLLATFYEFEKLADKTIEESINDECDGTLQTGYLAIVDSTKNLPKFWADRIHKAVCGLGTDDAHLIRIIVSRSEIDLEDIDAAYREKYEQSLEDVIASECSGDYKKMLIAICRMQE